MSARRSSTSPSNWRRRHGRDRRLGDRPQAHVRDTAAASYGRGVGTIPTRTRYRDPNVFSDDPVVPP
jgi:hypothetical protein